MRDKIIIYQILARLFGNRNLTRKEWGTVAENGCGKFNDITEDVLKSLKSMGVTHVWYTGVIRHASQTDYTRYGIPRQHGCVVKGKAGSPYAITDYYDVDPDLAVDVNHRMQEWLQLIGRTHQAGLKVVMDFVPNHVAREYHSICKPAGVRDLGEDDDTNMHFSTRNNFYYCWGQPLDLSQIDSEADYKELPAKATGNDHFDNRPSRNDWYETVKLNYGIDYCDAGGQSEHFNPIPDTWNKMTDILMYWSSMGVDAFRCDMAEMVPAAFWRYATAKVKQSHPDLKFIGEVYNPNQYRNYIAAGFDFLYDKVGMYDCLRDVITHNRPAGDISRQWQSTNDIQQHMLYFLENHDEQRLASDFFAGDGRKGIPALAVSCLLNTNPFMFYAGQEWGEKGMDKEGFSGRDGRTTIFDYWTVDSLYRANYAPTTLSEAAVQLHQVYKNVIQIAVNEPAVRHGQMFDLMYVNPHLTRQYAFMRHEGKETLLIVANFSDESHKVDVCIPSHAFDYLGILEKRVLAVDLLSHNRQWLRLFRDKAVSVELPEWGCRILKWRE